jgi:GNAT superfamily N-acetyltransferase
MMTVQFETMNDLSRKGELVAMMQSLYAEDAPASRVDCSLFPTTVERLVAQPARGRIVLFTAVDGLCGYALLIPYWSNEFGGALLFVDELFVVEAARNQGIARRFFGFLGHERPFDAVALALEVTARNARARKLYESLGFTLRSNSTLTLRLPDCGVRENKVGAIDGQYSESTTGCCPE